jgi:hypothetical protein
MLHGHLLSLNSTRRAFTFCNRDDDGTDDTLEEPPRGIQRPELEGTDNAGRVVGWFAPDRTLPAPRSPPVADPLITARDKDDKEHYSVVFLEPVDLGKSPPIFRRFGMGNIWDIDIEAGQRHSLVLVSREIHSPFILPTLRFSQGPHGTPVVLDAGERGSSLGPSRTVGVGLRWPWPSTC